LPVLVNLRFEDLEAVGSYKTQKIINLEAENHMQKQKITQLENRIAQLGNQSNPQSLFGSLNQRKNFSALFQQNNNFFISPISKRKRIG
jgi:hypothetical protein